MEKNDTERASTSLRTSVFAVANLPQFGKRFTQSVLRYTNVQGSRQYRAKVLVQTSAGERSERRGAQARQRQQLKIHNPFSYKPVRGCAPPRLLSQAYRSLQHALIFKA